MTATTLLRAIAVAELGAGAGLLAVPSRVAQLLAGAPLESGVSLLVARVAGAALVAMAVTCWMETAADRPGSPAALLLGLLAYNVTVPVVLAVSYFAAGIGGIGLWPTAILHAAFSFWIVACLRRRSAGNDLPAR